MSEGIKWGEDPDRDCAELKRLEGYGLYPTGHHDMVCPVCTDAPPVSNELVAVAPPLDDVEGTIDLPPREENTD